LRTLGFVYVWLVSIWLYFILRPIKVVESVLDYDENVERLGELFRTQLFGRVGQAIFESRNKFPRLKRYIKAVFGYRDYFQEVVYGQDGYASVSKARVYVHLYQEMFKSEYRLIERQVVMENGSVNKHFHAAVKEAAARTGDLYPDKVVFLNTVDYVFQQYVMLADRSRHRQVGETGPVFRPTVR